MREPQFDASWRPEVRQVHNDNQQFSNPDLRPNVYSWYRDRTERVLGIIRQHVKESGRVLDIGCAQGTIAIKLADAGYDVTGNDIRTSYLEYARLRDDSGRVNFVCDNFLEFDPGRPFDAVVFTEVIEHITDHSSFLKHIFDCLVPGGILIVTTPNHDYIRQPLPSFAEVNLAANKHREFTADGSDHFYLFKKTELTGLLQQSGFVIVSHDYFLPFLQYGLFKLSLLWRIFPASAMEALSRKFDGTKVYCAQQCVIAKRPLI